MTRAAKCFAIDYSGSTWNDDFYHSNVRTILNSKYQEGDEIIIWDTSSKFISKVDYMRINREKDGNGGTNPKCLFDTIFKKYDEVDYNELILISDGQIWDSEVKDLDIAIQKNLNRFKCRYYEIYLLGNEANLSVSCPFTRFNASRTIIKKPNHDDQIISTSEEDLKTIEEIDSINTLDEFNCKYDSLERALVARLLGTDGDKELRKSIILMHKRIKINNTNKSENKNEIIDELVMKDKNYDEAMKEVVHCFSSVLKGDFQSRINLLIRMCDGGLKQIFDADKLQTFREYTADDTSVNEVENIQNLNVESSIQNCEWKCPISIDNEIDPMILITIDENENSQTSSSNDFTPLLVGFDKVVTEKIINCPLTALHIPEFIEKLKSCIDHAISLKNYRASLCSSNPIRRSPFTRRKIIGAIPLGENQEHVDAANWTLMKLITGGKNLGDKNLWFFIIYLMIKNGEIPYLKDIEAFIEAQVIYRFSTYKTSISLSGLSNLPQTKVFYPTAAWSCLISPFLIPKISPKSNLFFVHLIHYKELLQILKLFDLQLPDQFQSFANRIEVLSHLLNYFKKNIKLLDVYKNGLKYPTILVNVDEDSPMKSGGICGEIYIPIDGEVTDEKRLKLIQKLSNFCYNAVRDGKIKMNELEWLFEFIDVQKNLTDMNVESLINGYKENDSNNNITGTGLDFWKEWDENVEKFKNVKISMNTCRPFYQVQPGITWMDELGKIINPSGPILSFDKYFGNFVDTYHKYPTKDEYILFLYRRVCLGNYTNSTLPKNIEKFTDQVFNRYQAVMEAYTPDEFNYRFQQNASIIQRKLNE